MTRPERDRPLTADRRPGRGAASRDSGRFERLSYADVSDGWDIPEDLPPLRTEVAEERPRSIITYNRSPDLPFDRSINPYRGCEHGCIYCFARPSHAYLGLSPGLDFETRLIARPQAPQVLARELRARRYQPAPLAIGTNTDPYQPVERDRGIMRACLEVLRDFRHPVAIVTKGTLVERDIDILSEMAALGLARVGISVTTLDRDLSRIGKELAGLACIRLLLRDRVELRAPGDCTPLLTLLDDASATEQEFADLIYSKLRGDSPGDSLIMPAREGEPDVLDVWRRLDRGEFTSAQEALESLEER